LSPMLMRAEVLPPETKRAIKAQLEFSWCLQ
jgi:hypothetical protein